MKEFLDIEVFDMGSNPVTLRKLINTYTLIYFYPKDETPGCTIEACSFRDSFEDIKKLGAGVIGISKDSVKSHLKFKDKHNLNFTLLSDPVHELQEAMGVWREKKFMGRSFMGTERMSFLLNPDGKIIKTYEKVKPATHTLEVLKDLKQLIKK